MPTIFRHTSEQHDGLSQLDSVFAQVRQRAANSGGQWQLEVIKDDAGDTSLSFFHTQTPPATVVAATELIAPEVEALPSAPIAPMTDHVDHVVVDSPIPQDQPKPRKK